MPTKAPKIAAESGQNPQIPGKLAKSPKKQIKKGEVKRNQHGRTKEE